MGHIDELHQLVSALAVARVGMSNDEWDVGVGVEESFAELAGAVVIAVPRGVVGGEDHDALFPEVVPGERIEEPAEPSIHEDDHRGVARLDVRSSSTV